ncbi:hypothetical protein DRQ25_13310 [Candidatus Fermentibacteria bacterium]|nr:MAG: hypothetical protein DRQ25_13310 [Candidatus Fermentibacteria bacterium]
MIPLKILLIVWTMATTMSAIASVMSYRGGIKSMGFALGGFAFGALLVSSFYFALLFSDISGNLAITVPWSRWANLVNGTAVLSASIAAYITMKGR